MTYIGVSPSNGVRRVHTYTASGSQTTFTGASSEGITLSYTDANFMDVYQNGVLLAPADYTATSGTSVVLAEGAAASDIVTITVYDAFSVADTVSKSAGGTFDGNVAMAGTLGVTGVLTGTSLDISGDIDIDGTTNLDVTDIDGTLNVAGETTLQTHLNMGDGDQIKLGASADLVISHTGAHSDVKETGTGDLRIWGNDIKFYNSAGSKFHAQMVSDGAVSLYNNGQIKLATSSSGVTVTGNIANASGDFTLDVAGDTIIDVDGGDVHFQDNGQSNRFMSIKNSSGSAVFSNPFADGDITFQGNDNGVGVVTPLSLDMSTGGRVGIGTTSPDFKLQVSSANTQIGIESTSSNQNASLYYTANGANQWEVGVNITAGLDYEIYDRVNNATRMIVNHNGNVGIGVDPSQKLHIAGAGNQFIYLNNTTTSDSFYFKAGSGASSIQTGGGSSIMNFFTAGNERARIDASGNLLLGTTTSRGKLTLGLASASSDGIMLDNSNGGATMDISLLGSSYNAHGAAAGEVWLYSPDNINIGGATGNGNHIKFLANNTVRVLIHGSKPKIQTHGVHEYFYHGSLANSQTVVNFDITPISSAGVMLIEATYTHYTINGYGASRISTLGLYGGSILSTHDIQNISSGNGGSWSYSVPSTGTVRITKNAGSYIGGGHYWIKVTTYM